MCLIERLAMLGSVLVFMMISFLQVALLLVIYKRSLKDAIIIDKVKGSYE